MASVSLQFLNNFVERSDIPNYTIRKHRRVYARSLLKRRTRPDCKRRKILDDSDQSK